jgi:hypothetical protein
VRGEGILKSSRTCTRMDESDEGLEKTCIFHRSNNG